MELALEEGFAPGAISFTGTNLTDRDMQAVIERDVHMNVDLLSQLRRYGRLAPGTAVGMRVNPRAGGAYSGSGETLYSGDRPTKFGIYEEQLDEALAIAEEYDLAIDVVHMHVGDGFLDDGLEGFEEAVERGRRRSRRTWSTPAARSARSTRAAASACRRRRASSRSTSRRTRGSSLATSTGWA